ncbi:MAG: eukaryotic-like serine/threonine-protein kinase [Pyrinomonadaceae bacterium]|nr:eukaryotic-like serine/threonine-protein kinase [Pyrinomonadaceae bacterium]
MLHCPTCGRLFEANVQTCPHDGATLRADSTIAAPALADPLVGRVLDEKYRLDRRLGEGGMGTVYRATHLLIDRPVAIKVLHQRFVEDEAAQERFRREARAAGRLNHTNAVTVTDFGRTSDGCVYIVMELLEGRNLREVLAFDSPLESGRAAALMLQVAAAVEAAHESGVIHRDLKPANIFIVQPKNAPPLVKVLDFGIAKLAADSVDESEQNALTLTGVMIGTPRYMSPEQCDGAHLTPAADVYSLGIILYEMLTGATPFTGASPLAVALQHSSKPPRRPTELVSNIPAELERVVLHSLEKNPLNRPADAGAFRRELLAAVKQAGLARAQDYLSAEEFENGNGAAEPTGRFVLMETSSGGRRGDGQTFDTTRLADATGRHRPQTGSVAAAAATDAFDIPNAPAAQAAQPFTRVNVLLPDRRTLLNRLKQPPVLLASALALLVLVVGLTAFIRTRNNGATIPVENATLAATPTPTPEATPTPDEAAPKKAQPVRTRRATRTAPTQSKEKKGSKVGSAFKKLKKVLNPF